MIIDSITELNHRLRGSTVKYKDNMVNFDKYTDRVFYYNNGEEGFSEKIYSLSSFNKLVDYSINPCGFSEFNKDSFFYIIKNPRRQYKYGITSANTFVSDFNGNCQSLQANYVMEKNFYNNIIKNIYPDLSYCKNILKEDTDIAAFDKDFGLFKFHNMVYVRYRLETIGYLEDNSIKLSYKYRYLKELLDEKGLRNEIIA